MATYSGKHVGRKRQKTEPVAKIDDTSEDSSSSENDTETPTKKPKFNFDVDEFRNELKGSSAFEKLKGFLTSCHQHEEDSSLPDPVGEYLQISTQCMEIMNLLDEEKRPPSENKVIFEVLTAILLRITDDLTHHASTAVHIVNRLLRSHIRHVYRALNSSNTAKIIMAALKLLAAMVTHSASTAKEVVALFRLDHEGMLGLLNRTDKKAAEDVRICMLRFLMSFLISNDSQVIEQLLSHRELMKSIFKGLQRDRMSTLHLILPTMQQYIICNPFVNKTQKLKLFNDYTLPQIAHLYDWQGINDMQDENDGKAVIRELVHRFLLEVTCDHKHGINFHDKTMGTSGKSSNATLLKFALTQKAVNQDGLVEELIVGILRTCPDVLPGYLNKCTLTFAPRNSHIWKTNMAFVIKVYSSLDVTCMISTLHTTYSASKMVSMAMVATVPAVLTQTMIIQGLKQGSAVTLILLDYILFVLKQAQRIKDAFNSSPDKQQFIASYQAAVQRQAQRIKDAFNSSPDKQQFLASYQAAVQRTLPDVNTVLPVWQKVLQNWKDEISGTAQPKSEDARSLPVPSNLQSLCKLMQVLCSYQQVLPSALEQTSHDFTIMLPSVFTRIHGNASDDNRGAEADLLQLQCDCLKFLMGFPTGRFRWFKEMKGEGTAMSRLLKELTSTTHPELYQGLTGIVNKILQETCLFEYSPSEVSVWLDNIMTLDPSDRSKVVTFLQSCLTKAIRNPHPYNDKIADCVASGQSSRQQGCQGDDAAAKAFSIKDIPDVDDINVDPSHESDSNDVAKAECDCKKLWPDPPLPCSALLPVSLEKFTQEPDVPDPVATYLTNVTTTLIHQQVDPLPLCLLLQQYGGEGKPTNDKWTKMLKYSSYWLLDKKPAKKFASVKEVESLCTFRALLQGSFECGPESLLTDAFWPCLLHALHELEADKMLSATRHALLYLHTLLDMKSQVPDKTLPELVNKYMSLIDAIVNHAIKLQQQVRITKHAKSESAQSPQSQEPTSVGMSEVKLGQMSEVMGQMARTILQHPVCVYWFQRTEQAGHEAVLHDPKQIQQVYKIVTGYSLRFLSKFQTILAEGGLESCIRQYAKKTFVDLDVAVDAYFALPSMEGGNDDETHMEDLDIEQESAHESSDESSQDKDTDMFDESASDVSIFRLLGSYINISDVRSEVVSACVKQPDLLVQDGQDGGKVLSPMGRVISVLATMCSRSEPRIGGVLAGVLQTTDCDEFGRVLLSMLKTNKNVVLFTTKEMLAVLLNEPTEVRAKVAAQLIEQSFAHRCHFESWCLEKQGQRSLKKHKVLMLTVLQSYWKARRESTESDKGVATLSQLWAIYWPWVSEWFVHDDTNGLYTTASETNMEGAFSDLLCMPKTTKDVVVPLLRRILTKALEEEKTFSKHDKLRTISDKFSHDKEVMTLVVAIQLCQMTVLTKLRNKPQSCMEDSIKSCHDKLKQTHSTISLEHCPEITTIWKQFIRHVLKDQYTQSLLDLIASLIPKLYQDPDQGDKALPLEKLYQMIVSHSQFLPSMLSENKEEDGDEAKDINLMKSSLAKLMLVIARLEPSCCQTAHFAVLLGAYSATLQESDRYLLALMNVYEMNNALMWDYRPYMWGSVAITQHAARKVLGHNLWQQPTMREVLELLDPTKLHESALKFPIDRKVLEPSDDSGSCDDDTDHFYDPCFLLPLFSHLLAPECVVDCKKFAECHALEFTMAALGSHDTSMRTAGYHVLAAYHSHLVGTRMMGKRELMYLIECLRNSITEPNCRVPNVVALFIGQVATVMMSPAQHIYPVLVQFLTIKPQIQMTAVPLFQRLFYSTNMKHDKERDWMMQLLLNGLRDVNDFKVCDKTGVFKTLTVFQPGVLCGEALNGGVFDLLKKACAIPDAAHQLVRQHSLLTWIDAHIGSECTITYLEPIISLLHTLSKSLFITNPISHALHDERAKQEDETKEEKTLPAERMQDGGAKQEDAPKEGKAAGRKLPEGTQELFFAICIRALDYFKPMSAMKPSLLLDYLETLASLCDNTTGDRLPLRTHHIAQLLSLYANVVRNKKLLGELVSIGLPHDESIAKTRGTQGASVSDDVDASEDIYKQASQALLNIIVQWRPNTNRVKRTSQSQVDTKKMDKNQNTESSEVKNVISGENTEIKSIKETNPRDSDVFVLYVIKWVLSTVSTIRTHNQVQIALTFVNEVVSSSISVQDSLAHGLGDVSKEIVDLLLSLYGRNDDAIESGVNAILMQIMSGQGTSDGGKLSPAVKKRYQKALDLCTKPSTNKVHHQLTAILLQELWSGCHQPHHFMTAWTHCIGDTPLSQKANTPLSQKKPRRSVKKTQVEKSYNWML